MKLKSRVAESIILTIISAISGSVSSKDFSSIYGGVSNGGKEG